MRGNRFYTLSTTPQHHRKAFKDNYGALELACAPKMRPCNKHIKQVYHHFRDLVQNGTILIFAIESHNQIADIFKKPLSQNNFLRHSKKLLK